MRNPWDELCRIDPDGKFLLALEALDLDALTFQIEIQDWVLLFKRTIHRFGRMRGRGRVIEIHPMLAENEIHAEQYRRTLLHELAHAAEFILTGKTQGDGHGVFWVQLMLELDLSPTARCERRESNTALHMDALKRVKPVLLCTNEACTKVIKRIKFYSKNKSWHCPDCGCVMFRP